MRNQTRILDKVIARGMAVITATVTDFVDMGDGLMKVMATFLAWAASKKCVQPSQLQWTTWAKPFMTRSWLWLVPKSPLSASCWPTPKCARSMTPASPR